MELLSFFKGKGFRANPKNREGVSLLYLDRELVPDNQRLSHSILLHFQRFLELQVRWEQYGLLGWYGAISFSSYDGVGPPRASWGTKTILVCSWCYGESWREAKYHTNTQSSHHLGWIQNPLLVTASEAFRQILETNVDWRELQRSVL